MSAALRGFAVRGTGQGHLYQRRFKSFLMQDLWAFPDLNALRGGQSIGDGSAGPGLAVVKLGRFGRQRWREGATCRLAGLASATLGAAGERVGRRQDAGASHLSIARGRPLGDDSWTAVWRGVTGLESTLRDPWRPRKAAKKEE